MFKYENGMMVKNKTTFKELCKIWFTCELCDEDIDLTFEVGKPIPVSTCPYYDKAAIKIQRFVKFSQRLPILYRVMAYCTQEKYTPEYIIENLNLDM